LAVGECRDKKTGRIFLDVYLTAGGQSRRRAEHFFMSGRRAKQLHAEEQTEVVPPKRRFSRIASILIAFVVIAALTIGGYHAFAKPGPSTSALANLTVLTTQAAKAVSEPRTLDEVLAMPTEQLANVDIARINLLCATGLPGAEGMDIDKCLAKLDAWAAHVKQETEIKTTLNTINTRRPVSAPSGWWSSSSRISACITTPALCRRMLKSRPSRPRRRRSSTG
jgi:hypothetical protein